MEFQTRSESTGSNNYTSFGAALDAAEDDKTIWKISFTIPETNERVRLVKSEDGWILENIYGLSAAVYMPEIRS